MSAKTIRVVLSLIALGLSNGACQSGATVPQPPGWMEEISPIPEWWSSVELVTNGIVASKWTARVLEKQTEIRDRVGRGVPQTRERREFIRYISFLRGCAWISREDRQELQAKIAETYSKLGDNRRSAREYQSILEDNPNLPGIAHSLALEYERAGDKEQALKVYGFMTQRFARDRLFAGIARRGIALLSGAKKDCGLKRPGWWDQFARLPEWWEEVVVSLPQTNSYGDSVQFVAHTILKDADGRRLVKANVEVSELVGLTASEKTDSLMQIALSYSRVGDHHRAIESAWKILEDFSADQSQCKRALDFVTTEFEKLGELDQVKAMQAAVPCFLSNDSEKAL